MVDRPPLEALDYAALVTVLGFLVLGYVVYPSTVFQYFVWLVVFTVWMAWFVYYGTKWLYGVEA